MASNARVHGVTLAEIHGEDVELHDSNTKAIWNDHRKPDHRRVVLSNRPIRLDEIVYVKLAGTGSVRLGFTNFSPYGDEDAEHFDGTILFNDFIHEKSIRRQIEMKMNGENLEAIYVDEFQMDMETVKRNIIPENLDSETAFLFSEISYGDIRLKFESNGGSFLTDTSFMARQIIFDSHSYAMLSDTTGGIIVPDIEMKIDRIVHIVLKPSQPVSSGKVFLRYGLTNIPPSKTAEETLALYSMASCINPTRTSSGNLPVWFRHEEIDTHVLEKAGSLMLCVAKDNELKTNINPGGKEETYVVMGPELTKPTWLLLEAFQSEVMVEVQHEIDVTDDMITNSRFIMTIWEEKSISDEAICKFMDSKHIEKPKLVHGTQKNRVLMIFEKEKNINFMKKKLNDKTFWSLSSLIGVHETCSVLVCNLPTDESKQRIGLFLSNPQKVKMKLSVLNFDHRQEKGEAVLELSSPQEVRDFCEKNMERLLYKSRPLTLYPYYDTLYEQGNMLGIENDSESQQTIDLEFKDNKKVQYIREYQSLVIENKIGKVCSKIKWRIQQGSKVRFEHCCQCYNEEKCKKNWVQESGRVFTEFLKNVRIESRKIVESIWKEVTDAFESVETDRIKVVADEKLCELELTGMTDDEDLTHLLATINSIKEPPAPVSENIDLADVGKLFALAKFQILPMISNEEDVAIQIEDTGELNLKGLEENVKNAKDRIFAEYLKVQKYTCELPNEHYEELLKSGMVRDKIAVDLAEFKLGTGIEWKASGQRLSIMCKIPGLLKEIAETITGVVIFQTHTFPGDATNHSELLNLNISKITDQFRLYARINYTFDTSEVRVMITCIKGYMETLQKKVKDAVDPCLTRDMKILLPEYIARYMNDFMIDELRRNLEREELSDNIVQYKEGSFLVKGTVEAFRNVNSVVNALANKVHMKWIAYERRGIDMYFSEEGIKLLRTLRSHCVLQLLTKTEMKNFDVHAVTVLDSGTVIFALAGDITDPIRAADVVVSPTDPELLHRTGIANAIAKLGGKAMREECSAFTQSNGSLKQGEVFVSTAGKLPYQRVFHVSLRGVANGNENEVIRETIRNIFRTIDSEDKCIFRIIAMPLLGDLTRYPLRTTTETAIKTLRECLGQHKGIREVYLYDRNPEVVRTIHSEMLSVFGNSCFSPPVENININKAKTIRTSELHALRRTGVRTIPLTGDKRLLIKWGELKLQQADVIVNVTKESPTLSGKISKSLIDAARSPGFDLDKEYENEFKKGNYGDGAIVQTSSGRLPCNVVYHLKIETDWQGYNGQSMLQRYIEMCLHYAIKMESKSIAFPTIGTADCGYPKDEVAQTFLRTVGEFMTKRSSCKLEEISVVIHKDDQDSTMQFEHEISQIYSARPHRLEAIIEEAYVLTKEGEDIENKEKKQQDGQGHVSPRVNYGKPKPSPANKDISSVYKVTDTVTLSLDVENIEHVTADVIVCVTAVRNFPTLFGAIPTALKKAGGGSIQAECAQKYPHGIPKNEIACTGAGNLNCTKLFYIPLQEFKTPSDVAKIKDFVKRCLAQADASGHASICFPSIGTGNFKYSDNDSSKAMFEAIQDYFSQPQQSLKKIVVALFQGATNTIQAFRQLAATTFTPISLPKGSQDDQNQNQQVQFNNKGLLVSIPNTSASVEIFEGQIESSQVDVILNTTTSFPNLNGAIPAALCRQGGKAIRDECEQYNGTADDGDIVETNAGNLTCNKIFHYVLPTWDSKGGVKIIQNCIIKCLKLMSKQGFQSIAMPAIGTGGYRYDPLKVAEGIYTAVQEAANYDPSSPFQVKIVLYPPAQTVNKDILSFFQQLPAVESKDPTDLKEKRVTFGGKTMAKVNRTEQKQDFVLLKIVSSDKEKINQVKMKIEERIKADSAPLYIDFPKHGEDVLKETKNMKVLQELGVSDHVDINVNFAEKKIYFNGISTKKVECREKLRGLLSAMADKQGNLIIGKHLLQNVEWCYFESNGKIMVPYPKSVAFNLETEDKRGASEVKFKDTDGQEYIVDLTKMEESRLENGQKTSAVGVLRKDLASGELGRFPDLWDPMDASSDVSEIPLDVNKHNQEYTDVLNEFNKTLGNAHLNQVKEIRRIQNKSLYLLYKAEKERLGRINQRHDNERILWHGTSADKEKYIVSDGFNRSHAGDTFGGKVWFGKGVYFAVQSEYSADQAYSPPDQAGFKRVFQVKVLTGDFVKVDKGYSEKVPPLKPGSSTERFDSTCDDAQSPKEFVIFRDTSAYPEYIILFQ